MNEIIKEEKLSSKIIKEKSKKNTENEKGSYVITSKEKFIDDFLLEDDFGRG